METHLVKIPLRNVVQLHRGVVELPLHRMARATRDPEMLAALDDEEDQRGLGEGIADAIVDFISDAKFLTGFYFGVAFVCLTAILWTLFQ